MTVTRRRPLAAAFAFALAASALAVCATAPAFAQQAAQPSPAQQTLARELVVANGEARAFEGIIGNVVDGAAASFLQTNPDLAKQLREAALAVRPEFEKRQSEITALLANAYAARFSEAELKEALAFYRSPTGQRLVNDRPAIVQGAMQGIQAWGAQLNAQAVEAVRAEMRKRGFDI